MLNGEGNENGEKTTVGIISKKSTLHVQHPFFCTFLHRCFGWLQRETSRNFLVTRFMEEMSDVFFFPFFFFRCRSFSPWWPLASRRNKISYCSSNKKCPLLYFFSLALALPPRLHTQIVWASCGHINLCRGKRSFKAFQIERDLLGQRIERGKTNM